MNKFLFLAAGTLAAVLSCCGAVISGGNMEITLDKQGYVSAVKSGSYQASGRGGLTLADELEEPVALKFAGNIKQPGQTGTSYTFPGGEISGKWSVKPGFIQYRITLKNHSDERMLRVVGLSLPIPKEGKLNYYNGIDEKNFVRGKKITDRQMRHRFPMSSLRNDKCGIAIGVRGEQYLSALESGSCGRDIFYQTHLVVEPGKSDSVDLILFGFDAPYGFLNALQYYQDIFKELFSPADGVNPRIYGSGGYVRAPSGRMYMEECRRFNFGWDWVYAPFQYCGFWYPEADEWNSRSGRNSTFPPQPAKAYRELETYRQDLRTRFKAAAPGCVAGFYIIPRTGTPHIVDKYFPDSKLNTLTGNNVMTSGVISPDVNGVEVYAFGNSFGKRTHSDMKKIAEDYIPGGFAFDEAWGFHASYGGKGVMNSPGRAFVEDEIYALQGVPIGKCMDLVHTFKDREGYRMSVIANTPEVFMSAFRSDAIMHENPYYNGEKELILMRRLLGRKPISMWEGYPLNFKETDPVSSVAALLRNAIRGTIRFSALTGVLPSSHQIKGYPEIWRAQRALIELTRAGSETIPAVRPMKELAVGRFGKDLGSYITFSNSGSKAFNGSVTVETSYFGKGAYIFTPAFPEIKVDMMQGGKIGKQTVANGRSVLQLNIPAGKVLVLKVAGKFADAAAPADVTVVPQGSDLVVSGGTGTLLAADRTGFITGKVSRTEAGFRMSYTPEVAVPDPAAVKNFPFIKKRKAACTIIIGDNASAEERRSADRLAAFFEYYFLKTAGYEVAPDIRKAGEVMEDNLENIVIISGKSGNSVLKRLASRMNLKELPGRAAIQLNTSTSRPCRALLISGDTEAGVSELLKLLEEVYPYYGEASAKAFQFLKQKGGEPGVKGETFE